MEDRMSRKLAKDLLCGVAEFRPPEGTPAPPTTAPPGDTFLRLADVMRATGLCRSVIYELMLAGLFPRPVKIGFKAVAWSAREIATWQAARIAARDAAPKVAPQVRRRRKDA
jgi:prophage regulatory protein